YAPLRERAARRLQQLTGIDHGFVLNSKERGRQDELVRRWVQWLHDEYPEQARRWLKSTANPATLLARFRDVPWTAGDPQRGRRVFERESCAACHRGRTALGPDLAGVARRFSREDLMIAIADPNRDVSSRYVATVIETHDGHRYEGTVIYDSVDGVTLLTNRQETIRVEATEIAHRATSAKSLMPEGLLAEATPQDIADLMAYLKTL